MNKISQVKPVNNSARDNRVSSLCDIKWIKQNKLSPLQNPKRSLSIIDLYSGCGGMTLGVMEALRKQNIELEIKLALDTNTSALGIYEKNFKVDKGVIYNGDINDFVSADVGMPFSSKEKTIKKKLGGLDILVAGPPCQGHSNLNNHTRRNDPRNDLYLNAVRFVELLRPKVAIIENVSTVIHDKDQVVMRAAIAMKSMGYSIHSMIVDTSKYGLAQTRKRHLQIAILGTPKEIDLSQFYTPNGVALGKYIEDIVDEHKRKKGIFYQPSVTQKVNIKRINYLFDKNLYTLPDEKRPDCHKNKKHSYKSCYGRMYWDKPAQTITSGFGSMGQGRYVHPIERRVITPHEAARIQGFPDFFDFSTVEKRGDLHTMIANAVPPKVTAMIISHLLQNKAL